MTGPVVSRRAGFGAEGFVAEVTFATLDGGTATVREYGATEWGARARAEATAAKTLTARRRVPGFHGGGFRTENRKAEFEFGFARAG